MKIVEIETFGRGGLTHYVYNLSGALADKGHEVIFVTAAAYELEGRRNLSPNVQIVKSIGRATSRLRGALPQAVLRLALPAEAIFDAVVVAGLVRRMRPDVIHLHCTNPVAIAHLALLRRVGRPVVYTAHVVTPHEPVFCQGPIYRQIHRLSDLIVAHSGFDRARLLNEFSLDSDRVTVIPHGEYGFFQLSDTLPERVTARQRLGVAPDEEVALFFGYIREYKGLDVLLEAWPKVVAARPKARLVVAGDPVQLPPSRREELGAWAARVGAVHRFEYIPFLDVSRYFVAADTVVMPYRRISQSGVLFLALSLGVPVIVTRVGPLADMLDDGDSALLVPPESPSDLADALIRLLRDAALRDRLAKGGRRVAGEHTWPLIAERTERAFSDLVQGYRDTT